MLVSLEIEAIIQARNKHAVGELGVAMCVKKDYYDNGRDIRMLEEV